MPFFCQRKQQFKLVDQEQHPGKTASPLRVCSAT
jgi:hypothetical protein